MQHTSTTRVESSGLAARAVLVAGAILMAVATPLTLAPQVRADQWDDQISALTRQANQFQSQANEMRQQANTLENRLNDLRIQKSAVEAEIEVSQAQYNKLTEQITQTEQKIVENQDALGSTIADLYVDDTISPLEMLASSKNIGDYVDKQTYRTSVQDQLTQTIATIKDLKAKLESDKKAVQDVLATQTEQRNTLAALESEQQRLLDETRGQEAAYQQLVSNARAQMEAAHAQQQAYYQSLLARNPSGVSSGVIGSFQYANWSGNLGCAGGYPAKWCVAQDTVVDSWALYNRECVSYVAWALEARFNKYVASFNGRGNAYEWPYSAVVYSRAERVYTPQPGDAVILPADPNFAPVGHAMIVESVSGDWMRVSQYNMYGSGQYSTMDIKNSGIVLLRFKDR